nr:mediator of RNA polymerase II transcription subunit 27 [Tanacetum cinerariifolium]
HHGFSELHQLDTFYNALNPNDQDALDSLREYSRSRVTDQMAAELEDKLDIRMNRFEKALIDMKNSLITPTAPLKAVTEVCVTCGSNHSYNQCNKLEDYGVLNELLRSRSNSRGLYMPLVCLNGTVVTYACKRQLAGQAGASAVDRTSVDSHMQLLVVISNTLYIFR